MIKVAFTVFERCDALERDAELVRVEETRRVVEEFDVLVQLSLVFSSLRMDVRVS